MQLEVSFKWRTPSLMTAIFAAVMFLPCIAAFAQNDQAITSTQTVSGGEAKSYWTEERMLTAKPLPFPMKAALNRPAAPISIRETSRKATIASSGGPGDKPYEMKVDSSELSALSVPEPVFGTAPFSFTRYRVFPDIKKTYKTYPYNVIGQLFFTIPGMGNFVCSASVINASNLSVVWTAGHCVYTPGIGFHTNVVFVPGTNNGKMPFEFWNAKILATTMGWGFNALLEYDHGAVALYRGGKHQMRVAEDLGYLGFLADAPRMQHWHLVGYPVNPRDLNTTPPGAQFDGLHQEICAAAWATDDQPTGNAAVDPATIGVGCDQTGGTSGGPWLVNFSGFAGLTNLVNGNNSYKYNNLPLNLYGPYFTTGASNVRDAAQSVFVP